MFAEPSIEGWPRAPWMVPDGAPSLITTGLIAGTLHARGLQHPWLDGATRLLWSRVDSLTGTGPYDVRAVLRFLDSVPDRDRAHAAAARLGPLIFGEGLVALEPGAPGEVHTPLDFAPCRARPPGACSTRRSSLPTSTTWPPPSATTAAGCSTGRPGRRRPSGSGAAPSP